MDQDTPKQQVDDPTREERILLALKESGFDLEWRVANLLGQLDLNVFTNVRGQPSFGDPGHSAVGVESDIMAILAKAVARQILFFTLSAKEHKKEASWSMDGPFEFWTC